MTALLVNSKVATGAGNNPKTMIAAYKLVAAFKLSVHEKGGR